MFEHAEDSVKQFAHDGDQGDHLGFAASAQMFAGGAYIVPFAMCAIRKPQKPQSYRTTLRYTFLFEQTPE